MTEKPIVTTFDDGSKIWSNTFEKFEAKVYVPKTDLPEDIITEMLREQALKAELVKEGYDSENL